MPRLIVPRPIEIPIGPSIAYVPLTQGLYALIDREDADRVGKYAWHAAFNRTSGHFYARRRLGNARWPLHDEILGRKEGFTVDHISSENTLDNRKANLRHATKFQQVWNRGRREKTASGFLGVYWEPKKRLYRVLVRHNGKAISGGRHKSPVVAAAKRDEIVSKLHGEFARLNFAGGVPFKL